jgi:hypothetical protein
MPAKEFGRREHPPQEARPQPMPHEGPVSKPWKWAITVAIAVVLLLTMYGITGHRVEEQHAANPPAATGSLPETPPAGGRATGDASPSPRVSRPDR